MAKKYALVSYIYDRNKKGRKYTEEEIVTVPGITLGSLADIDKFTAKFRDSYSLSNFLKMKSPKSFSIVVTKSDNSFYYNSVIYNRSDLLDIVNSLEKVNIRTTQGVRTFMLYNGKSDIFVKAWREVEEQIIVKNSQWLYKVFGENGDFANLINKYIKADPYENNSILLELATTFRNYEVFRKYITNTDKKYGITNFKVVSSSLPLQTIRGDVNNGKSINCTLLDDEEDDYEPDHYAFLSNEETEKADGEGNIGIDEYRGRRNAK